MKKKSQKIQIIFETTIEVNEAFADFMEMTLDEALAYQIDTIKEYPEDRMEEVAYAEFKGIKHVNE